MTIGSMYALIPKLFGQRQMWSIRLIDWHFWIATVGVVLYVAAMWVAGITQGLMWRATNPDGTLTYTFVEGLKATYPYYMVRLGGGILFLSGMLIMLFNLIRTAGAADRRCPRRRPDCRREPRDEPRICRDPLLVDGHADRRRDQRRRPGGDRAAVLPGLGGVALARHQALPAAGARRPRRVRARGLLQLPLADDPAAVLGDPALWALLHGRGIRVRPPVPVRLQAHRTRSRPLSAAATPTSGIAPTSTIHATWFRSRTCRDSVARAAAGRRRRGRRQNARADPGGGAVLGGGHRCRRRGSSGEIRNGRTHRLPAIAQVPRGRPGHDRHHSRSDRLCAHGRVHRHGHRHLQRAAPSRARAHGAPRPGRGRWKPAT